MTYQRDPNRRAAGDYIRRDDGSWSIFPILAVAAFVLLLGYLLLGTSFRDADTTRTQRSEAPRATMPNNAPTVTTPAPAPATPSK